MKHSTFNQNTYINAYSKEHYDRVTILLPKGDKDKLKSAAEYDNMTVTQYVVTALKYYENRKGQNNEEID